MNGVEEAVEEGEVDQFAPLPKVHVRGVNSLNTNDLRNFATEHFSDELFKRVEWVDDTSANLIYDTELTAAEALQALSAEERADPLEARSAKRLTTHPDVELFVRQAVESDVKVKDARLYSRYYLDNAADPENPHGNRRGKRTFGDRNYRQRDYGNGYKRRRYEVEDDNYSRRGSQGEPFDVNLYDDDPASVAARQERSNSYSSGDNSRKRARTTEEVLPDKSSGRLRDRSASPGRDGDGRYGFQDDQPRRRTARARSPTPPEVRKNRQNRGARDLLAKELFPNKKAVNSALTNGHTTNRSGDLFPNHSSTPKTPRELFPTHKRQEARDLDSERRYVEEGIGRYSIDGTNERDTYHGKAATNDRNSKRNERDSKPRGGDLFSRISGGPTIDKSYGRLQDRPNSSGEGESFSFKGAGSDFNFLGAGKERKRVSWLRSCFRSRLVTVVDRGSCLMGRSRGVDRDGALRTCSRRAGALVRRLTDLDLPMAMT